MSSKKKETQIAIRCDPSLKKRLGKVAERKRRELALRVTSSDLARKYIEEGLRTDERAA